MLPDETQVHIHQLAVLIADDAARADIEMRCPSFTSDGHEPITVEEIRSAWYDTSMVDSEMSKVTELALRYLTLRGQVIHHPLNRHWVRLTKR